MLELKKIEEKLSKLSIDVYNRTKITLDIKRLFAEFFCKPNTENVYSISANKMGEGKEKWDYIDYDQEFMFDLTVVEEEMSGIKGVPPYIIKTILSLESELDGNLKLVIDDFQKLLLSNSEFKVMVFKCHSNEFEQWTNYMKKNIDKYKNTNGTFFLIGFLNDKNKFNIIGC